MSRSVDLARERPIVVLGRGHSGTRLVAWTLARLGVRMGTREDKATGDVQDRRLTRTIAALARRAVARPALAPPPDRERRALRRALRRYLAWLPPGSEPWGWKYPETCLIGPLVLACCPRARFVHVVRDGRAAAARPHRTDDPRHRLGRAIVRAAGAEHDPPPLRAARCWAWQLERWQRFAAALPPEQHLELRFEALLADPEAALQQLAAFAARPVNALARAWFRRALDPARARAAALAPAVRASVERAIAPTLRRFGYDAPEPAPSP